MRFAGASLAILLAAGCGVGDDSDLDNPPVEPNDPNPNGIVCTSVFTLSGSWTEGTPTRPPDTSGCWPVGTWTFSATLDPAAEVQDIDGDGVGDRCGEVSGTSPPTFDPSYSFIVNRVDNGQGFEESYEFVGDETRVLRIKVTEGGGKECSGALELVSPDGKQLWNFKPDQGTALDANGNPIPGSETEITGQGEYTVFLESQRGGEDE